MTLANTTQAQFNWQWAQSFPTLKITGVATDASGDVFVTGSFAAPVTFNSPYGQTTLTPTGMRDIFLARFDERGSVKWARQVGGAGATANGISIALDGAGSAYLVGDFAKATLTVNTGGAPLVFAPVFSSLSDVRACVLKYSAATGTVQWSRASTAVPGGRDCLPTSVAASQGGCFVGGFFGAVAQFDTTTITGNRFGSVFVAAYSPAGALRWVKASGTLDDGGIFAGGSATAVATDFFGNCYLTGYYRMSDFTFGGLSLPSISTFPLTVATQAFVARLNPATGNAVWLRGNTAAADSSVSRGTGVSVATGGCYVGGTMNSGTISFGGTQTLTATANQGYLARYNAGTGATEWVRALQNATDIVHVTTSLLNVLAVSSVQADRAAAPMVKVWSFWPWGSAQGSIRAQGGSSTCSSVAQSGATVYLAGSYSDVVAFGRTSISAPPGATPGAPSTFLAQLNLLPSYPRKAASEAPTLAAYPNPAAADLQVKVPAGTQQVTLLDHYGRVVRKLQAPALETTLDVRGLPPGPYVLRSEGPQGSSTLHVKIGE